jgi:virginiamycin B lyase
VRRILITLIVTASAVAACQKAAPGWPEPTKIVEYAIPWNDAFPSDIVVDSTGIVWFTDRIVHVIGRFDPSTGTFTRLTPPTPKSAPYGLIGAPDGGLWYAASTAGLIGRIDPATGQIEEHRIPDAAGGPQQLALSKGVIWFSLRDTGAVGRFDTRTGAMRLTWLEGRLRPYGVAVTPDGHVWFSTMENGYLVEIDPDGGPPRVHDLGEPPPTGPFASLRYLDENGRPAIRMIADSAEYLALPDTLRLRVQIHRVRPRARRLAADSAGNLWLTDYRGSRVVRFDPARRDLTSFRSLARGTAPYAIATTRSGLVVYSATGVDRLVILDPESGARTMLDIPTPRGTVRHLWIDELRGNVWLPMSDVGRIAVARARDPG